MNFKGFVLPVGMDQLKGKSQAKYFLVGFHIMASSEDSPIMDFSAGSRITAFLVSLSLDSFGDSQVPVSVDIPDSTSRQLLNKSPLSERAFICILGKISLS